MLVHWREQLIWVLITRSTSVPLPRNHLLQQVTIHPLRRLNLCIDKRVELGLPFVIVFGGGHELCPLIDPFAVLRAVVCVLI